MALLISVGASCATPQLHIYNVTNSINTTNTTNAMIILLASVVVVFIFFIYLFTFRGSKPDYKIHRDMEIVTFAYQV